MNIIVIYQSNTGFTAQYAKWIAEALNCECKTLKQVSKKELEAYNHVIFGGWIMGDMISGLSKMLSIQPCPTAVFAVGSTPAFEEVIQGIKTQNKLSEIPFFYLEGGFHFDKLGFAQRILLKAIKKSVGKKENRSRQEDFMAQELGTSFDHSGQEQLVPLVEYMHSL